MQKFFKLSSFVIILSILFTTVVSAQATYKLPTTIANGSFFMIYFAIICSSAIISLMINSIAAYAVYNDAKKNNVDNAILWTAFSFFFPLIGILIYFLAIKPGAIKSTSTQISDKPVVTEIDTVSKPVELIKDSKKKKATKKDRK
jgi:hypothetical protein